ncbi:MAG: ABC transporter permease, partial [Acidobacteria bacterium]|nr:ABC transporter permease [Acidobacteriota bacterium]
MRGLNPLRYALRGLVHSPLFTVTVVASLAIGIAASSTIFGLADALFLRPRAGVVDEARVVDVGRATDGQGFDNFGYQVLLALQQGTQTLEGIAGFRFGPNPVSLDDGHGGSERAHASLVSANYFKVLGTRAAAGRLFAGDEDRVPDQAPLAVLNYDFWTRRYNRSPDAIGQTLRINRRPYTVIGVAEPGFHGTTITGADLWVPFAMAAHITGREGNELLTAHGPVWHMAVARLRPGVSLPQARDELNALLAPLKEAHPDEYGRWSMALLPSGRIPGEFRTASVAFVGLLFLLTAMVLAIACSNVAGMLLARALGRRREMATRLAVGASRAQIAGHLMVETAVLFFAAGMVSLMLSWWMVGAVMSFMPSLPLPVHVDLRMDWRMFGFALAAALVTASAFGLAPALGATRLSLVDALHGQHSTTDHRRLRLRHVLLGGQVALSLALLVTTGLFVRALQHAADTDTGYDGANVRVFSFDLSLAGYRDQQAAAFADRLLERMSAIGGVERAATSFTIPLQGSSYSRGGLRVPGYTSPRNTAVMTADWDVVSPTYFETLGVPIVRGRGFDAGDREGQGFVAIVNETF